MDARCSQNQADIENSYLANVTGLNINRHRYLLAANKSDLLAEIPIDCGISYVSAKTGYGLEKLRSTLLEKAGINPAGEEDAFFAHSRHLQALQITQQHVTVAAKHVKSAFAEVDICAEEMRLAQTAIEQISGATCADDLLGEIFSRFCIGK